MSTVIASVDAGSPAERAGICAGETLLKLNRHEIVDVLDYRFFCYDPGLTVELAEPDGTIRTFIITKHGETPGLGSNAADRVRRKTLAGLIRGEKTPPGLPPNRILDQYAGHSKSPKDQWKQPWKVKKDGGDADYVTGATISSRAVNELAWKAVCAFEKYRRGDAGSERMKK